MNAKAADALRDQIDQLLLVQKGKELNINVDAEVNRKIADIQSQSKIADPEKFHEWIQEADRRELRRLQAADAQSVSDAARAQRGSLAQHHYPARRDAEVLRRAQGGFRPAGYGAAARHSGFDGRQQSRRKWRRRRRKPEASWIARAKARSSAIWRGRIPTGPPAQNDGELGSFKKGQLRKEVEDVVFTHDKGYVTDPDQDPGGLGNLPGRRALRSGPGQLRRSGERDQQHHGGAARRAQSSRVLTQLRTNAFLQIKPAMSTAARRRAKTPPGKTRRSCSPETTTKEAVAANKRKKLLHVIPYGHVGAPSAGRLQRRRLRRRR